MVNVYTASAGSGKTYQLVLQYLCLAFREVDEYRHIQAVTFTNKATLEMKERIIKEIYILSIDPNQSPHYRDKIRQSWLDYLYGLLTEAKAKGQVDDATIIRKTLIAPLENEPNGAIQRRAKHILRSMLINYRDFRVSTIDSFFQEVLRSFIRELDIRGNYQVELETQYILDQASKAILLNLQREERGNKTMDWLLSSTIERMEEGEGHKPLSIIQRLAEELTQEELQRLKNTYGIPSKEDIGEFSKEIKGLINDFHNKIKRIADEIIDIIQELNIAEHLSYGESGGLSPFFKISKGNTDIDYLPNRFCKAQEDLKSLIAKKEHKSVMPKLEQSNIPTLMQEYEAVVRNSAITVATAKVISRELPSFGLISDIDNAIKQITSNERSLLISDTSSLINRILTDTEGANFIFEKLGIVIKHFMIDEFQDTSSLQYDNFRPLLEETDANGGENLIVGDVKQSIYRWRGAESSILGGGLKQDFQQITQHNLKDNWRSSLDVINFNNNLYKRISRQLAGIYAGLIQSSKDEHAIKDEDFIKLGQMVEHLAQIYDTEQEVPEQHRGLRGNVILHEYEYIKSIVDEYEQVDNTLLKQLPEVIVSLQERGFKPNRIAIIVRKKAEATFVSQILDQARQEYSDHTDISFDYYSDEALSPSGVIAIDFLLALLELLVHPENKIAIKEVESLYQQMTGNAIDVDQMHEVLSKGYRSLYETIELLIAEYGQDFSEHATPYLIKFLDTALAYQQDRSRDVKDFIEMWREREDSMRLELPADSRKLQLLTIHKSKGLEYDAVLLPFLHWELIPSGQKGNILWCSNPLTGLNTTSQAIPYLPVRINKKLLSTMFAPYFLKEAIATSIDALNLLYVATTRAKQELHLWAFPTKKDLLSEDKDLTGIHKQVIGLIQDAISQISGYEKHELGKPLNSLSLHNLKTSNEDTNGQQLNIDKVESFDIQGRIEELHEGLAHFDKSGKRHEGIVMHHILSMIEGIEDLAPALRKAAEEGNIELSREPVLADYLNKLISNHTTSRWFDGSGRIFNENPILGDLGIVANAQAQRSYRPDRIVIYPDKRAEVIDYKFGTPRKDYELQVRNYGLLLRRMGYIVRMFIWYISLPDNKHAGNNLIVEIQL